MERLTRLADQPEPGVKAGKYTAGTYNYFYQSTVEAKMAERLAAYEDTGLEPEEIENLKITADVERGSAIMWRSHYDRLLSEKVDTCYEHIMEMLQATVYYIYGGKIYKAKAVAFRINESGLCVYCQRNFMGLVGFEGVYGETVFLTREEADAALKKES